MAFIFIILLIFSPSSIFVSSQAYGKLSKFRIDGKLLKVQSQSDEDDLDSSRIDWTQDENYGRSKVSSFTWGGPGTDEDYEPPEPGRDFL